MGQDFHKAELTSVPITLILLIAVFGALIAAGIPVLLAGSAVMVAVSLLAVPSRWLPIGSSTAEVVLIIGMAVGVDYSLFYLRREREERAAGASFPGALATAAATSGRAILVSGLTVMVSMAGLLLTGIDLFTGIAVGTIMVVGVTVAGSLTLLPALLSFLGPWADRGRIPFLGRHRTQARPSRLWAALVHRVVRRPLLWGGTAGLALLALAVPALSMRTGTPPIDLPSRLPVVHTLEQIQRAFPAAGPGAGRGHRERHVWPGHAVGGGGAAGQGVGPRSDPPAGHRAAGRRRPRAGDLGSAGWQRVRHGVPWRAAGAARPDPARHHRPRARSQLRRNREHGQRL